jgi:hypothetical protein
MNIPHKLKSRKFAVVVVSSLIMILNDGLNLGLPQESLYTIGALVVSYVFGESYVDSKREIKEARKPPDELTDEVK